jgi:lysozyme family protein
MTFDEAFKIMVGHEGGFQDDPRDRGNWTTGVVGHGKNIGTKYGISGMSYPAEDIKGMTLDRARAIYLRDFWQAAGCDYVPPKARFSLFDTAVNSGVRQAIKFLQRAVGAQDDGVIGPKTLMLLEATPPAVFIARYNGHRLQFMSALPNWPAFGRGWANRVAKNLLEA